MIECVNSFTHVCTLLSHTTHAIACVVWLSKVHTWVQLSTLDGTDVVFDIFEQSIFN